MCIIIPYTVCSWLECDSEESVCFVQHLFALEQRDELIRSIQEAAGIYVGISVKQRKEPITFEQFQAHRLGKYRYDVKLGQVGLLFLGQGVEGKGGEGKGLVTAIKAQHGCLEKMDTRGSIWELNLLVEGKVCRRAASVVLMCGVQWIIVYNWTRLKLWC